MTRPDWITQVANKPFYDTREYDFSRTNGTTASADLSVSGAGKVIALTNMPYGLAVGSNVYISGGTGTAESAAITAISGSGGDATGSITVTTANAHTGAWTVSSNNAGLQEATNVAAAAGKGEVYIATGDHHVHGRVTVPSNIGICYRGAGPWSSIIWIDAGYSGDLFYAEQAPDQSVLAQWEDFHVVGNGTATSGYAIHIKSNNSGYPYVRRVHVDNGFGGVWVDDSDYVTIDGFQFVSASYTVQAEAGIKFSGVPSDCRVSNSMIQGVDNTQANILKYGIRFEGADGIQVINSFVRADTGISIYAANGKQVAGISLTGNIIDSCRTFPLFISGAGTPAVFGDFLFDGNHLMGNVVNTDATYGGGVQIAWQAPTIAGGVQMIGNRIANMQGHGLVVFNVPDFQFIGNHVRENGKSGAGITNGAGLMMYGCDNATAQGNRFYDRQATATQKYGMILGGNPIGGSITRNAFYSVEVGGQTPMLDNGFTPGTHLEIGANMGVDDVRPTIASANTITLSATQPNSVYFISGNTVLKTLTTASGAIADGRKLTLIFTHATPAGFDATGNFAIAVVPTQNRGVTVVWDAAAGKWFPMN